MLELNMGEGVLSRNNISLNILRIGQEYCDPKKLHEVRRWSDKNSLHFVLHGRGTLIAGGDAKVLNKGDVFLLYADEEYEYYPDPTDPWAYIWVDFSSNATCELFAPCGLSIASPVIHVNDLASIMGQLKLLYEAYDASDLQELRCSAYFMLILSELIKNAERKVFHGVSSFKQHHIRNIVAYINNNFRLPLTIREIAIANQISTSRMMTLFSELLGISPIAYLNCFRVATACEILRTTDIPIGKVASMVGVEDPLYFSRLFRKCKGMSPREYRVNKPQEDPFAWQKKLNLDFN